MANSGRKMSKRIKKEKKEVNEGRNDKQKDRDEAVEMADSERRMSKRIKKEKNKREKKKVSEKENGKEMR